MISVIKLAGAPLTSQINVTEVTSNTDMQSGLSFKSLDQILLNSLCVWGVFNAHVGNLYEVRDFHGSTLVALPALHEPPRVQRTSNYKAGRLLVDLAAVF